MSLDKIEARDAFASALTLTGRADDDLRVVAELHELWRRGSVRLTDALGRPLTLGPEDEPPGPAQARYLVGWLLQLAGYGALASAAAADDDVVRLALAPHMPQSGSRA